jgi:hypothetical protein
MTKTELIIAIKMLKRNKRQFIDLKNDYYVEKVVKEYEESISKFEERLRLMKELKDF